MGEWRVLGFVELRELGAGAQGRAVLVREVATGRVAVLKYLFAGSGAEVRERFRKESVLLKSVASPYVARWYGHYEHGEGSAILMEAVPGRSLRVILDAHGALGAEAALVVLKGSLLGLAAAHQAGVVHRDYKPANVVVRDDGLSKLIDFGVALYAGETGSSGTPAYMAPEQWRGETATPATDVYAATCVFHECVTGERPYTGDMASIREGHLHGPVPVETLPEALRSLAVAGMAKDPAERPATAARFVDELESVARGAYGPDWERRGFVALATAAAALAAFIPAALLTTSGASGLAGAGGVTGSAGTVGTGSGGGMAASGGAAGSGTGSGGGVGVLAKAASGKIALTVSGLAAAGAVAGTTIYATAGSESKPRAVAAATPQGVRLRLGDLSLVAPAGWTVLDNRAFPQSYQVAIGGGCPAPGSATVLPDQFQPGDAQGNRRCIGFSLLDASFLVALPTYLDSNGERNEFPIEAYTPGHPYAARYIQDAGFACPPNPTLRAASAVGSGSGGGAQILRQENTSVGGRQAIYTEYRIPCWTETGDQAGAPGTMTNVSYIERQWYLPDTRTLIIDMWSTPDLERILATAQWT